MRIEHVAMYVSDLERTRDFFEKYFHARANYLYHNPRTGFSSYFLSFESGARLEIMQRSEVCNGEKSLYRAGSSHIAFSLGSKTAVDALTERLRADGFAVISGPRTTGDGYYESCILDLEGNQIEICE